MPGKMSGRRKSVFEIDINSCFECDGEGVVHAPFYGTGVCPSCGGSGEATPDSQYDELICWSEREQEAIIAEAVRQSKEMPGECLEEML